MTEQKHEPGWYVVRRGGDTQPERFKHTMWEYLDGWSWDDPDTILAGPFTKAELSRLALLGLRHTPREGETCKDCDQFEPMPARVQGSVDGFCSTADDTCASDAIPCTHFLRKEQPWPPRC